MKTSRHTHLPWWVWLICVAGFATLAPAQPGDDGKPDYSKFVKIPSDTDEWTRHLRIGALVGMNISAKFNESGVFNISGNSAANGIYADGYVREDQTGNAGGYTSYWGYNNASQYNGTAQTLTMHSTSSYSTSGNGSDNGGPFLGLDMAYGDNFWYWEHARIGFELGFGLLPITINDTQPMSAAVMQSSYIYDTGGILMPNAPYQGGPSGQGPLLPGSPASVSSQTLATGTVNGMRTLDVMLYTLRLGPSFYWVLADHLGVTLSAGPAIGVVTGNYKYNEIITAGGISTPNAGSFGTTDLTYGGYVNGTLMLRMPDRWNENADIFVSAQYMPMGDANFNGVGRQGRLNMKGQLYFSVGLNWPF